MAWNEESDERCGFSAACCSGELDGSSNERRLKLVQWLIVVSLLIELLLEISSSEFRRESSNIVIHYFMNKKNSFEKRLFFFSSHFLFCGGEESDATNRNRNFWGWMNRGKKIAREMREVKTETEMSETKAQAEEEDINGGFLSRRIG